MAESRQVYSREFIWKVTNFFSVQKDEFIESPVFQLLNMDTCLRLYPKGKGDVKDVCLVIMSEFSAFAWFVVTMDGICEKYTFDVNEVPITRLKKFPYDAVKNYNNRCIFISPIRFTEKEGKISPSNVLNVSCVIGVYVKVTRDQKIVVLEDGGAMSSAGQGSVSLSVNLQKAFNNPRFADVTLKVGVDEFHAHKIILISRSKVFAQMFDSDMKESRENVVDMVDMKASTVRDMLQYIYTGKPARLSMDRALDLYAASDKYDIPRLKERCKDFILAEIGAENICDVALLADLHSDEELKKAAKRVLKANLKEVLKTQNWRKFAKENPDLYSEIIESAVLDEGGDNTAA